MRTGIDEFWVPIARRVVEVVGANWLPPARGRWLQLIAMPSFSADLVVTVTDDGSVCRLLAHTAQCNVHAWEEYSDGPPEGPRPVATERLLEPGVAQRLWGAASGGSSESDVAGLDGTTYVVRHRLGDELVEFDTWGPRSTAAERPLVELLLATCNHRVAAPFDAIVADLVASLPGRDL